jgi:arginine decarboxylase
LNSKKGLKEKMSIWNIQKARETYNIAHWSDGYFDINEKGQVVVFPDRNPNHASIELLKLVNEFSDVKLSLPVFVRFTDILHDRIDVLSNAFAQAMTTKSYQGNFTAVYPIKVNQQRQVVKSILNYGGNRVGLEAGSKAELIIVLALIPKGGTVICNGYKDREYIRLALIGVALGHKVHIVVEKPSELDLIIEESGKLKISPILGLRVRLAAISSSKWQNTGGEKAKFGLSSTQVIQVIARLRAANLLDCLQLIHVHMGSQITNIRDFQCGLRECVRYYAELHRLGINIRCIDVGGGLGIDYEGTRSRSSCSVNYSIEEYANNIVLMLREVCDELDLPHPDIITEAGRAMTAHHAVLIINVIETESFSDFEIKSLNPPTDNEPPIIHALWKGLQNLSSRPALEIYHDAVHWFGEVQTMYTYGVLTLEQRARAEKLYFATCRALHPFLLHTTHTHREILDDLNEKLADKYFCNFSLFQSIPDVWGIKQIFPILPLHRLDEQPTQRGIIQDITCDSDGRIDYYVDNEGIESTLSLHKVKKNEPYLLGIFLVGAYQEILGDMHNLFGDTDSVNLEIKPDGNYRFIEPQKGDTVKDLLEYVHFDSNELLQLFREKIVNTKLTVKQQNIFLEELEARISGYTYLKNE